MAAVNFCEKFYQRNVRKLSLKQIYGFRCRIMLYGAILNLIHEMVIKLTIRCNVVMQFIFTISRVSHVKE